MVATVKRATLPVFLINLFKCAIKNIIFFHFFIENRKYTCMMKFAEKIWLCINSKHNRPIIQLNSKIHPRLISSMGKLSFRAFKIKLSTLYYYIFNIRKIDIIFHASNDREVLKILSFPCAKTSFIYSKSTLMFIYNIILRNNLNTAIKNE